MCRVLLARSHVQPPVYSVMMDTPTCTGAGGEKERKSLRAGRGSAKMLEQTREKGSTFKTCLGSAALMPPFQKEKLRFVLEWALA